MVRRPRPRVLIGGLGMGYTLRAALDQLPPAAEVTVVELNPVVVEWCRGPLAALTDDAVADRRVRVEIGDVAGAIAGARRGELDAILLDLYEGPRPLPPHASGSPVRRARDRQRLVRRCAPAACSRSGPRSRTAPIPSACTPPASPSRFTRAAAAAAAPTWST